jgi:hypothetical protein
MSMPPFGYPRDFFGDTPYSANLIHQAYHLMRWQEWTGLQIADMQTIAEIGGGYGAMALVARRLGFRGTYTIYDLPEFSLLQEYFLGNLGAQKVTWNPKGKKKADLLIACYSLSEMRYEESDAFLARLDSRGYLILYSNIWKDRDNVAYFSRVTESMPNHIFLHARVGHLPPESWYTFGTAKL